ncbi:105_t:CDS:1, partial [Acaulospora colombiana]
KGPTSSVQYSARPLREHSFPKGIANLRTSTASANGATRDFQY